MTPLRCSAITVALAAVCAAAPAQAQNRTSAAQERPATLNNLITCRSITDSAARLACYDSAAAELDAAEQSGDVVVVDRSQVAEARRQLFGFEIPSMPSIFERGSGVERIDSIETTLVRATQISSTSWVFVLEDGSTWRQIDGESLIIRRTPGTAVRVRRAAMGSYLLTIEGTRAAIRVRRQ